MTTYLFVYFGPAYLALVITPIVIRLARRIRIVDIPGPRQAQTKPISHIGGVAIYLSMMFPAIGVLFLSNAVADSFRVILPKLIVLLCAAAFMFFTGLIDDIKTGGLRMRIKFIAVLSAAIAVCAAGIRIESVAIAEQFTLNFGWFSWPLTIFWIVGITNAVNLSDSLDGLAAGISVIACGVIAIFAFQGGNVVMAVLMLALLGSLSGFLFFNFSPAKIFMGNCGSLFLGFTIASASVMCATKSVALVGLALPFLALGVPIFDMLFSILRRFLDRRSLFSPDGRHFHRNLIDLGLGERHVIIIIYGMTLLSAGLGMFMIVASNISSLIIFFCILLLLILAFQVVDSVRLKETIAALQKIYVITKQLHEETRSFEDTQLYFRNARTYDQWWSAICNAAGQMDFAWLSLKTTDKDGSVQTEVWRIAEAKPNLSNVVTMTFPLADNDYRQSQEFEIAVSVNGSYESAGHRATLFSRLIDEHEVVNKV